MNGMLHLGIYGMAEAATLARVPLRTAHRWVAGSGREGKGRVLRSPLPRVGRRHAITFHDVIDLRVVGQFRDHGISLQNIRRVYEALGRSFNTDHAFSHRKLLTDGQRVFIEIKDGIDDPRLEEVLSGQHAMHRVLREYLKDIDYGPDGRAERWRIAPGVVIDPRRSFGKPVIANAGPTTYVLARSYAANKDNADLVADLYGVTPDDVKNAVKFEESLVSPRAA